MPRLPSLTARKVISLLGEMGFTIDRIIGSHHVLVKEDRTVIVPVHGSERIPKGTLMAILKQAGVSKEVLTDRVQKKSARKKSE